MTPFHSSECTKVNHCVLHMSTYFGIKSNIFRLFPGHIWRLVYQFRCICRLRILSRCITLQPSTIWFAAGALFIYLVTTKRANRVSFCVNQMKALCDSIWGKRENTRRPHKCSVSLEDVLVFVCVCVCVVGLAWCVWTCERREMKFLEGCWSLSSPPRVPWQTDRQTGPSPPSEI